MILLHIKLQYQYQDAIAQFDKALAIDSKQVFSLQNKGECLKNEIKNSIFLQQCQINKMRQQLIQIKQQLIAKVEKFQEAITWLDKTLAIDPKDVCSLSRKVTKKYNDCLSVLDGALSINPNYAQALQNKGKSYDFLKFNFILQDQQKYQEALNSYAMALKIDPNHQQTRIQKEFCEKQLDK